CELHLPPAAILELVQLRVGRDLAHARRTLALGLYARLALLPLPFLVVLVLAQDAGARIDIQQIAAVAEPARAAPPSSEVDRSVADKRLVSDEVLDVVAHVLLHGVARFEVLGNLRPHFVPRPVHLAFQITP